METSSPELLSLQGIAHSYRDGGLQVLQDVSLSLESGGSLALLGPSGCGKSTLLMIAAGLLRPSEGKARFDGKPHHAPDPQIALMQQQYGLFPWKSVGANIELGLQLRGLQADSARLSALLGELGIADKLNDYPGQLSGGQQQRVALARSLLLNPSLLLLDEPFGALDSITRERLQDLLLRLWRREGFAMLTVTHSIQEAVMLGRRILVMSDRPGRITEVIDNPGMEAEGYRGSPAYSEVLDELRAALGAAA